ncbi:MAG: PDZ domain-containing protein [Nitrospira sp.]|nr:PDZ domain-containing protein [Nitrospira sp.]
MAAIPPQRVRRIGLFLCLVVCALLIAHSINAFVAEALYVIPTHPVSSGGDRSTGSSLLASYSPTQAAEDVRSSGLFLLPVAPQSGLANADRRGGGPSGAPVRASLGLAARIRLIGVVLGDQRGMFAIAEELASKQQTLYRVHDQVLDLGEVSEIRRNGILVRQGNLEELLELAQSESQAVPGGSASTAATAAQTQTTGVPLRKVIDRREVEQAMSDLPKLLSQARAAPHMVNGAINGFRLDYIAPTSFYEKIGVQTGDVLQRVNGVDIRDPSTMLNLLQQLKNEQTVKLDVLRNNQRSTITYELR